MYVIRNFCYPALFVCAAACFSDPADAAGEKPRPKTPSPVPAPTLRDVPYGTHPRQVFDLWLAESQDGKPTPLAIFIHGGGFRNGDKADFMFTDVESYLKQGISYASLNYRLSDSGTYPIMMQDAARAVQSIRSRASEWNLDPDRVVCYGTSAGAGISLWLAFHDDLADPSSDDPVARQSTRMLAVGVLRGQPTYDMRTYREWFGIPQLPPHPGLPPFFGAETEADWESDRVRQMMVESAPLTHLTADDPPVFMYYTSGPEAVVTLQTPGTNWIHHALLGIKLQEAMQKLGLESHVTWPKHPSSEYRHVDEFLQSKLRTAPVPTPH